MRALQRRGSAGRPTRPRRNPGSDRRRDGPCRLARPEDRGPPRQHGVARAVFNRNQRAGGCRGQVIGRCPDRSTSTVDRRGNAARRQNNPVAQMVSFEGCKRPLGLNLRRIVSSRPRGRQDIPSNANVARRSSRPASRALLVLAESPRHARRTCSGSVPDQIPHRGASGEARPSRTGRLGSYTRRRDRGSDRAATPGGYSSHSQPW